MTDTKNEGRDASTTAGNEEHAARCCGPVVEATCCEPEAKASCCGEPSSGACGCV